MLKKLVKFSMITGLVLMTLSITSWLVIKQTVTAQAKQKARLIITKSYEKYPPQANT